MKHFFLQRFGCAYFVKADLLLILMLFLLFGIGFAGDTFANRAYGYMECDDVTQLDERIAKEKVTLFMTICDIDGVKRLLSSEHPAILTQGLYFLFPKEVEEYEICQNDGAWIKTAERVYLDPKQTEDTVIRVRFRAKGKDGSTRYSRSFVLIANGRG